MLGALIGSLHSPYGLFGIQYGLPSVYNPDEVAIMARALAFAKGTLKSAQLPLSNLLLLRALRLGRRLPGSGMADGWCGLRRCAAGALFH